MLIENGCVEIKFQTYNSKLLRFFIILSELSILLKCLFP